MHFIPSRQQLKNNRLRLYFGAGIAVFILFMSLLAPQIIATSYAQDRIYSAQNIPQKRVALIFGSGLTFYGEPTEFLKNRLDVARDLYANGNVRKIIVSGDNRQVSYNEPDAMRIYLSSQGVNQEDIILDYGGRSTFDSCYRAKHIFKVDQAILVTHTYHLPRAIYTCSQLGIDATGSGPVSTNINYKLREIPSTVKSFWKLHVIRSKAEVLGEPMPI